VLPKFVEPADKLFSVDDVFNGIKTKSCFSDIQFFVGKGAGAYPTASAVISDISALSYDYRYEYKKLVQGQQQENDDAIFLKVFFRHNAGEAALLKKQFVEVHESFLSQQSCYFTGIISLANLKKITARNNNSYSFILFEKVDLPSQNNVEPEEEIELRETFI
jgi:homoserine dehydrogenase